MKTNDIYKKRKFQPGCGFTFIEVCIALAVVAVSLVALLGLHMVSIKSEDAARETTEAILLANEKIAEALASNCSDNENNYGIVSRNSLKLHWQRQIDEATLPQLQDADVSGLKKVLVDISWKKGDSRKHLQMSTYAADKKIK